MLRCIRESAMYKRRFFWVMSVGFHVARALVPVCVRFTCTCVTLPDRSGLGPDCIAICCEKIAFACICVCTFCVVALTMEKVSSVRPICAT